MNQFLNLIPSFLRRPYLFMEETERRSQPPSTHTPSSFPVIVSRLTGVGIRGLLGGEEGMCPSEPSDLERGIKGKQLVVERSLVEVNSRIRKPHPQSSTLENVHMKKHLE